MYLIRARQHRDEDIRFRGHLGRRALPLRSATGHRAFTLTARVPGSDLVPGPDQVRAHGKPIRPTPVNPVRVI
jgi:hypothetical protein